MTDKSTYLHILGRQPAIGIAELEARFGSDSVTPLMDGAALVENENVAAFPSVFPSLGGSIKIAKLLTRLPTTQWHEIVQHLETNLPKHLDHVPEGKLKLGISLYGFSVQTSRINAGALQIKKAVKNSGRSVRIIPNLDAALSSAQVLHNQLTGELGMELLLFRSGNETILAGTAHVQDIDSYSLRDRGRPMRDARVGMLPPKLAQIIVNLAVGQTGNSKLEVLDPFCGTGVILQEALLMGHSAYGTDLEPRMIEYTLKNLEWLTNTYRLPEAAYRADPGDATGHMWQGHLGVIASETYLGRPFTEAPAPEILDQTIRDVNIIFKKFLSNMHGQLPENARLCLAVPAWHLPASNSRFSPPRFRHLPVIDELASLGYNNIDFKHVRRDDLVYHRENQIVARELLVLTRK